MSVGLINEAWRDVTGLICTLRFLTMQSTNPKTLDPQDLTVSDLKQANIPSVRTVELY